MPFSAEDGNAARCALLAAVLGLFLITLDVTGVNVALPSMRNEMGGGITALQWVVDGYTVMFAALLLSAGALTDRIGARRAFGAGLAVFVFSSAGCALAPSMAVLVGARFCQGVAAAVIMPSSMALLGQAYVDPVRRARAVGLWAMGGAVAASSGPVLGGLLALVSWRWIFLLNVPVGAIALLSLSRVRPSPHWPVPFDWVGQITAVAAMSGLTYGAIEAGAVGLTATSVVTAFAAATVALAVFGVAEARGMHPMLPLELFRSRTVTVCVAGGFALVVGFYGLPFVMSLYLQEERGLSPLGAGLAFVPMMVLSGVLTPVTAPFAERFGARPLVTSGLLLMAAGLTSLAVVPASTPVWALAALMAPVGLAAPLVTPPLTAALLSDVRPHQAGIASGAFNTSRQVGGALAIAVFGALLANPAEFLAGMRASLLIAAVVGMAAAAGSSLLGAARTKAKGAQQSRPERPSATTPIQALTAAIMEQPEEPQE